MRNLGVPFKVWIGSIISRLFGNHVVFVAGAEFKGIFRSQFFQVLLDKVTYIVSLWAKATIRDAQRIWFNT